LKTGGKKYSYCNKRLRIDCVPADNTATVESAIIANVPTLAVGFDADYIWTSCRGCVVNVNADGC
jgi:hypothetical protein